MSCVTLDWTDNPPDACRRGAVAIGNFDGVHRGHAALIAGLREQAQTVSGPAVAVTFDPHPLQLLRPEQFQPVLTTMPARAELLHAAGADHVVVLRTTPELLRLSAEEFFDEVVLRHLGARGMAEGVNFGFGRNREGDIETLRRLCERAGVGLTVVPPFKTPEGVTVSSSRVRSALERGAAAEAARLLDRPYRLAGRVAAGQRRGQSLGFPTANLHDVPTLIPRDGVYAVRAGLGAESWPAAANVGPNPTFGEQARKVEVHLIGFGGDLYGRELAVDFLERLRDTRRFDGVSQLVEQLRHDVEQARRITQERT